MSDQTLWPRATPEDLLGDWVLDQRFTQQVKSDIKGKTLYGLCVDDIETILLAAEARYLEYSKCQAKP